MEERVGKGRKYCVMHHYLTYHATLNQINDRTNIIVAATATPPAPPAPLSPVLTFIDGVLHGATAFHTWHLVMGVKRAGVLGRQSRVGVGVMPHRTPPHQ